MDAGSELRRGFKQQACGEGFALQLRSTFRPPRDHDVVIDIRDVTVLVVVFAST